MMIKKIFPIPIVLFFAALVACSKQEIHPEEPQIIAPIKPNILMILIDDLGYTDLGLYGGNIATSNIDALGKEAVIFSNAHVNPSCAPTRASFITCKVPHRVGWG